MPLCNFIHAHFIIEKLIYKLVSLGTYNLRFDVIKIQWLVFWAGLIFYCIFQKGCSMIPGTPRSSGSYHYVPQTISCRLMLWWTSLQFVAEQRSPVKTMSLYNMLTYLWHNLMLCPWDIRHTGDTKRLKIKSLHSKVTS